ncbi:MAG: YhgE/Pip family protein [Anaerocolumna sp.]
MKKTDESNIHLKKDGISFRKVFRIFKADSAKILTSWVTIVILAGLTILPPVYAWLNIFASWDPYGNTKGLKVAVINEDAGGTIFNLDFNIGTEIVSNLKTNDKLGWVFCDNKDKGIKMVQDGDVYAAIIIPEDFSLSLSTILDEHPKKLSIDYYKNQKMNAIAPKIIDSATNTLKTEISTSIIETAVKEILEKVNTFGTDLKEDYPDLHNSVDLLDNINENIKNLPDKLNNLSANVENGVIKIDTASEDFVYVKNTINDLVEFNNNMTGVLSDTNENIDKYSPELRANLASAQSLFIDISEDAGYLSGKITADKPTFMSDINKLRNNLTTLKEDTNDISDDLLEVNSDGIPDVIEINNDISSDIDTMLEVLSDLSHSSGDVSEVASLSRKLGNLCDDIADNLDDLEDQIGDINKSGDNVLASLENIGKELSGLIDTVNKGGGTENISATLTSLVNSLTTINGILGQNQKEFSNIISINNKIMEDLNNLSGGLISEETTASLNTNLKQLSVSLDQITQGIPASYGSQTMEALKDLESLMTQMESLLTQLENSQANENIISMITSLENSLKNINSLLKNSSDLFSVVIATNNVILRDLQELSKSLDQNGLNDLENDINDLNKEISTIRQTLNSSNDDVKDELNDAEKLFHKIDDVSHDLADGISELSTDVNQYSDSISVTLKELKEILSKSNTELSRIQGEANEKINTGTQDINGQVNLLGTKLDDLNNTVKDSNRMVMVLDDIKDAAFQANSLAGTILNSIDDEAFKNLENNLTSGSMLFRDINSVLTSTKDAVDDLSDFSDAVADSGETSLDRLEKVKKEVPKIQSAVTKITDKIDDISGEVTYDDLINLVHRDVEEDSDYFSSPVVLSSHDVYVSENYGKGLAPFYSVLALWVGGMFLGALLKTKLEHTDGQYSPREEYFGKYLLFGLIALAQGMVTALGDLFILRIPIHNPVLFVILCSFFSLMFSMIIYSLVSTLNNVGKALGIILLLLQVTASGGTFPIQVTPVFFRTINEFMPFTYAINGLREAIYGVNFDDLMKDFTVLLLFGIIFTLYGCLFKKRLNNFFEAFSENLKKAGIIH